MKKLFAVLAVGLLIVPIFAKANEEQEKVKINYYFMGDTIQFYTQEIDGDRAEKIEKAFEMLNKAILNCDRGLAIAAITYLRGLGLALYFIDRLEDIIDWMITPATKASVFAHIFSYGHGCTFIPCYKPPVGTLLFYGFMFRPIYWKFNTLSYTIIRKMHFIPPRIEMYDAVGRQEGLIVGFFGLFISINRVALPDTNLIVGRCGLLMENDLIF